MKFGLGPRGHRFLGVIPEYTRDTPAFMLKVRSYGDLVKLKFGPFPFYVASHPELFHSILVEHPEIFKKSAPIKRAFSPAIGSGIFISEGDFWKRQRKLMQPAFHTRRIASYTEPIRRHTQELVDGWTSGSTVDIETAMTEATMRIITEILFGASLNNVNEVGEAMVATFDVIDRQLDKLLPPPSWFPTADNRQLKAAIARLDALLTAIIDERRRSDDDRGDLLSMLLMARDEDDNRMDDKQVLDEAKTLFAAGHETTAVTMTWVMYLLSQHPEAMAKVKEEVDAALGGRPVEFEDLPNLPFGEMVIKEALRLYPPAWGIVRDATQSSTLAGQPLPKGTIVALNIYGVQRDAEFFPNPNDFMPERFSPENEKKIPRYAYIPFGLGPRVCIGNALSMMEARIMLATIVQTVDFQLKPGQHVSAERRFTLRPSDGMDMIITPRQRELAGV